MALRHWAAFLGLLAGSGAARADDTTLSTDLPAKTATPLKTDAAELSLGAELRAEVIRRDHGLEKVGGQKPRATTDFEVQHASLLAHGKLGKDTDAAFGFDLRESDTDYGYLTHWFLDVVGVSFGKMRVMQGGWDNAAYDDYTAHATGVYAENLVFENNAPMAAVTLKAAGSVTLQILNDKVAGTDAEASWNRTSHLTWVIGWRGDFGPITPLLDVGSYDNNKSRWVDAGFKMDMNGLTASLDLYSKNQVNRHVLPTGIVAKADVSSATTLNVAYEVKGYVTPWFYFSGFEDKQAEDAPHGLRDHEYNTTRDAKGNVTFDDWDDDGQVVGFGVNVNSLGKGWTPYLAFVNRSGKFEDTLKPGQMEDKSELWMRLGVLGAL